MNVTALIAQLHEFNPWAEILVGYIERKGIQQNQLAKKIHVVPGTVSAWITEERFPKGDKVIDLIEVLELPDDEAALFIRSWIEVQRIRDLIPLLEAAAEKQNWGTFKRLYPDLASLL